MDSSVKCSIVIMRPAEIIYPWIVEERKIRKWMTDIHGVISADDIPDKRKQNAQDHNEKLKKPFIELVYAKSDGIVLGRIIEQNLLANICIELFEERNRTKLTYTLTPIKHSIISNLLQQIMIRNTRKKQKNELYKLKHEVEADRAGHEYASNNLESMQWRTDNGYSNF